MVGGNCIRWEEAVLEVSRKHPPRHTSAAQTVHEEGAEERARNVETLSMASSFPTFANK
jgi:hypothetical protein